jgi:hypothetical protein
MSLLNLENKIDSYEIIKWSDLIIQQQNHQTIKQLKFLNCTIFQAVSPLSLQNTLHWNANLKLR